MMILGVGLVIVIAIGLGIYFGIFYDQDENTINITQRDQQHHLLIELIKSVTQLPNENEWKIE